ncbi:MAG: NAD-dependent epimerase/dehydratase family protein [Gemmatimonadaceae bacterium]|nr:NAD-dependent epimerase/dehydratase family protein [Gemmatimonadaceae bacterium]
MALRALVTGGAGFIGSHVADALIAAGYGVTVLDDFSSGKRENVPAAAEVAELDVRDADAAALVRDGGFDVVCHLAAQIDVRKSVTDPVADASRNVLGALNLLEAVRAAPSRPRFVFSSTGGAVYGDQEPPPSAESQAKDPESPYGIAKLAVEYYLSYYGRVHGIEAVALRYANVYGPRQDPRGEAGVVAIFCRRLLEREPLVVFGDGLQTRDYVYVGDVARANVLAARAALPAARRLDDRAYNIGTGVPTSVLGLAAAMQRAAGVNGAITHAPARQGEQLRSFVDVRKAGSGLGWAPEVSLDVGVRLTLDWFRRAQDG